MVLLISYDLNGPERPSSYTKVKEYIEQNAASYRRPLYSQWLVETNAGPQAWSDALMESGIIDNNDRLFVVTVRQPCQGWLDKADWEWLNQRTSL